MTARSRSKSRDVGKNFGGLVALRDVSLLGARRRGDGLIGPNGAGKSTLFEIISGNLPPSARRVSRISARTARRTPTTYASPCRHVPHLQKVRLFESMTVRREHPCCGVAMRAAGAQRVDEVAKILGQLRLEAQANRRPSELTLRGSQARRDRPRHRRQLPAVDARRKHVGADRTTRRST